MNHVNILINTYKFNLIKVNIDLYSYKNLTYLFQFLIINENMKCTLPESVISKCEQFVRNFNKANITNMSRNIVHDKTWKKNICIEKKS